MTYKEFEGKYVLSLDNHSEIVGAVKEFCTRKNIKVGNIYGIGAVNNATLRFLNPQTKLYVDKTFEEQMEIANLIGNISEKDGEIYLHLHITLGRSDYSCVGGHLLTATINGACELFIEKLGEGGVGRCFDDETGLNLYKFV